MKLSITFLLILVCQLSYSQDRIQKIDSLLNDLYAKEKINGNFLIAEKGEVIYSRSFGMANEETKEKLTEESVFELASTSKAFTAMAIVMLKEQGKLKLEDDITKYIPALSHYKGISVRNLLHHTGGLPDYMGLMDSVYDKSRIAVNNDIITVFSKHKPAIAFTPNAKWEYSNTGYALLASIIEKASGMSYGAYLEKNIFKPLKMKNTFVYTRRYAPKKTEHYAYGYVRDSLKNRILPDDMAQTKMVVWLDGIVGDGTVNSTVRDLLIWDRALYTNKLVSKESMNEIFMPATLTDGNKTSYGYGWLLQEKGDFGRRAYHSGGWPGYSTFIDRHTENDKTIIILQNNDRVSVPVKSISNILYNISSVSKSRGKEFLIPAAQLQKFTGTYEVREGLEMAITLEKDQLYTQLTGQEAYPIFPESDMLFFLKVVEAKLEFEKNDKGEITGATLMQNGNKIKALRIK